MNAIVPAGAHALMPTDMGTAIQLAEMMARGKLVPAHLHNSPGDCLMVVEQAVRWGMSPFAVAQCTSVIQGKLMFEGKLVAAALNASGILSSRLDYDFRGENGQRAVIVRGTLRGETKPREVTVFLADAKTSNSLWAKQPDQQLVYAGTRVWARRHAPEVMLGVYAPEEFDRAEPFNGTTIDAEAPPPAPPPAGSMRAAAAEVQRAPRMSEKPKVERTDEQWKIWIDKLRSACAVLQRRQEVVEIGERKSVGDAIATAPPWARAEISAVLAENYARFGATEDDEFADDGEVLIEGESKVAAG